MSAAPSTRDAGGYMGDWARGAPLGRASRQCGGESDAKLHLACIRLDSGGYDRGGAYWGYGGWLWEAWDDAGEVYLTGRVYAGSPERKAAYERLRDKPLPWDGYGRAVDRETAKAEIRDQLGEGVRFYR